TITLMATVDFGPRIIYFGMSGKSNLLFEDSDRIFSVKNGDMGTWYTYGGHRLWCAPEILSETYYPDNESVSYSFENETLTLVPPKTPFGKQFCLIIKMNASDGVQIESRITNLSKTAAVYAPWSITALSPGGTEIIPLNTKDNGYLPNRELSLWSYSDIYDSRFKLLNNMAVLRHDKNVDSAFKAGFNVTDGYTAYMLGDQLFIKQFESYRNVSYPDFSSNLETYVNKHFLECELVGEYRSYSPEEAAVITESWRAVSYKGEAISDSADNASQLLEYIHSKIGGNLNERISG
ncbi:MAG: hypothetical protein WC900_05670, partial [Oscillospiraceae bacterium]